MRVLFFLATLISINAYRVETVRTSCLWFQSCFEGHAKELQERINNTPGYVSHSTVISGKYFLYTTIVFKP